MILWRIARAPFADLSGGGARLHGGRWSRPGRAVVYLAEHPALALLEILVHLDLELDLLPDDYRLMRVDADEAMSRETVGEAAPGAETDSGNDWLENGGSALLRVPSIIVPHAFNWTPPETVFFCLALTVRWP